MRWDTKGGEDGAAGLSHVIADIEKWDGLGMSRCNPFGILVDGWGEGPGNRRDRRHRASSSESGKVDSLPLINTDNTDPE